MSLLRKYIWWHLVPVCFYVLTPAIKDNISCLGNKLTHFFIQTGGAVEKQVGDCLVFDTVIPACPRLSLVGRMWWIML